MQASLEIVVTSYEKTKAEILCALKSITAGYSTKSFSDDSRLFQTMFPKKTKLPSLFKWVQSIKNT